MDNQDKSNLNDENKEILFEANEEIADKNFSQEVEIKPIEQEQAENLQEQSLEQAETLQGQEKSEEISDGKQGKKQVSAQVKETRTQAIKYFLCMCSAGVIELISYLLLTNFLPIAKDKTIHFINDMSLLIFVSELISLGLSIVWNFTFNRKFTFKSSNNVPVAMSLAFLFYVPFYPFALWFVPWAAPAIGIFAKLIKMVINGVLEFMWQKFIIYGKFGNALAKKFQRKKA